MDINRLALSMVTTFGNQTDVSSSPENLADKKSHYLVLSEELIEEVDCLGLSEEFIEEVLIKFWNFLVCLDEISESLPKNGNLNQVICVLFHIIVMELHALILSINECYKK